MPIVDGQEMKNVSQLIETLRADPALGRCTLRAQATWDGDLSSRVIPVDGFRGSGGECLYAEDLLELLAKCITFDALGFGAHQGLDVAAVTVDVEGDIDFAGSVGLDAAAGFGEIRVEIQVDADADGGALERLRKAVQQVSVVGRSLAAVPQKWSLTRTVAP